MINFDPDHSIEEYRSKGLGTRFSCSNGHSFILHGRDGVPQDVPINSLDLACLKEGCDLKLDLTSHCILVSIEGASS